MKLKNWRAFKGIRQKLRNTMTRSEQILWARLKGAALGVKFRRQHGIGPYIVDFFCPEQGLVIEIDGATHAAPERVRNDSIRLAYLKALGLTVLVYADTQVFESVEGVVDDIRQYTGTNANHP